MPHPWIRSIHRTLACASLAIGLSVATAQAAEPPPAAQAASTLPAARCIDLDKIRASGPLHEMAQRSYEFQIKSLRPGSDWDNTKIPGDGVGRWMLAMCRLGAYLHEKPQPMLDEIPRMLKMRNKFGVFGPDYPPEVIDGGVWFDANHVVEWAIDYARYYDRKFGMDFLREFVEASFMAREPYLRPGPRQKGSHWRSWGETASDFAPIQGMSRLAMLTGEAKYKGFVNTMAELAMEFRPHFFGNGHAHATSLLINSLVLAHEATGEKKYLDFAVDFAAQGQSTAESCYMALPDYLGTTRIHTEGCAVVDWLRVNLDLGRVTGEARYFDKAERLIWGPYFHLMSFRGGMGCGMFGFSANRYHHRETGCCCNMHGANGVVWALQHTVLSDSQGLTLPLYHPFTAKAKLRSGKAVEVSLATTYPDDGAMLYRIERTETTEPWRLRLRVPAWAKIEDLRINGRPETLKPQDGWLDLTRAWQPGDEVSYRIPMTIWFSRPQSDAVLPVPGDAKQDVVLRGVRLFRGPALLCVEQRANEALFDWEPVKTGVYEKLAQTGGPAPNGWPSPRSICWNEVPCPLMLFLPGNAALEAAMPKDETPEVLKHYIPSLSFPSAHRRVLAAPMLLRDPKKEADDDEQDIAGLAAEPDRSKSAPAASFTNAAPSEIAASGLKPAVLTPIASKWKYVDEQSYWPKGFSWIVLFDVALLRTPEGLELLPKAQGERPKP